MLNNKSFKLDLRLQQAEFGKKKMNCTAKRNTEVTTACQFTAQIYVGLNCSKLFKSNHVNIMYHVYPVGGVLQNFERPLRYLNNDFLFNALTDVSNKLS